MANYPAKVWNGSEWLGVGTQVADISPYALKDGSNWAAPWMGAWTDVSSSTSLTWTGYSAGTSTVSAFYKQIGKMVWFRGVYTFAGATFPTSGTAWFTINLPVTADTSPGPLGQAVLTSAGVNDFAGMCGLANSGAIAFHAMGAGSTYTTRVLVAYNVPFTWKNTDVVSWQIAYEAA